MNWKDEKLVERTIKERFESKTHKGSHVISEGHVGQVQEMKEWTGGILS